MLDEAAKSVLNEEQLDDPKNKIAPNTPSPSSSLPSLPPDKKDIKDLLIKEYDHRFTENSQYIGIYHKQLDFFKIFVTVMVALVSNVFFNEPVQEFIHNHPAQMEIACHFLIVIALLTIAYFYNTLMTVLFLMYINGARMASIEKKINTLFGDDILLWQHRIIGHFYDISTLRTKWWFNPNHLHGLTIFILIIVLSFAILMLCGMVLPKFLFFYCFIIIPCTIFYIGQWILLNQEGAKYIYQSVEKLSSNEKIERRDILQEAGWIAATTTMIVGLLIPWFISLDSGTFWFSPAYQFPFVAIPSVWFGDGFVLPFFNYKLSMFLIRLDIKNFYKKHKLAFGLLCLLSLVINSITHYIWTQDEYYGYMDYVKNQLSPAGWVHFAFSSVEMSVILNFIFIIWRLYHSKCIEEFFNARHLVATLLIFTSISFLDFTMKYFYIFKGTNIVTLFIKDLMTFIPFWLCMLVTILYFFGRRRLSIRLKNSITTSTS